MPENLENSAVAAGMEKVHFHSNPKEGQYLRMLKLLHSCTHLILYTSKVALKILPVRLQQYMNRELPDVQAGFRKRQRNQRSNCQHPLDHRKSKRVPKNTSTFALLTMPKPLCGSQQAVENSSRDGHTRPPDLPLEKSVCRSRSNS